MSYLFHLPPSYPIGLIVAGKGYSYYKANVLDISFHQHNGCHIFKDSSDEKDLIRYPPPRSKHLTRSQESKRNQVGGRGEVGNKN